MNFLESIRIAMRGLSANKLRAVLTMLGIIIGVGAVITLMSVGQGVQDFITAQLQSAGSNLLFVIPVNLEDTSQANQPGFRSILPSLTTGDWEAINDPFNAPDVAATAPEVQVPSARVSYLRNAISASVSGVTPEYEVVRNSFAAEGSFISNQDLASRSRVVVLGVRAVERLFEPGEYAVGRTIKINDIPFEVIGIMEEKGGGAFGSEDDLIFVPMTTAQERLLPQFRSARGEPLLSTIYIQAVNEDRMEAARSQIEDLLRLRHNIQFRDDDDFTVINQADLISIFDEVTNLLTIFLASIAAISLLVGGIGIMNIMLVSVTERTREVGIRKAIGARRQDILAQFLIEAMALTLIGGFVGIALGWGGALAITSLVDDFSAVVTAQSVLLATGISTLIGLVFGIYPALRAASLNPIDALRYE